MPSVQVPASPTASDRGSPVSPRHRTPKGPGWQVAGQQPVSSGLYMDKGRMQTRRASSLRDELRGSQMGLDAGDGGNDMQREMDRQKEIEEFQDGEAAQRCDNLKKHRGVVIDKPLRENVLSAPDDDPDEFMQKNIDFEVDHILADPSAKLSDHGIRNAPRQDGTLWWSSESAECHDFRYLMGLSATRDEDDWCSKHRATWTDKYPGLELQIAKQKLRAPPRYLAMPLPPVQEGSFPSEVQTEVTFLPEQAADDSVCCPPIPMKFSVRDTAEHAIHRTVACVNESLPESQHILPSEFLFKVIGKADFVYGKDKLIDFIYIRKCLQGKRQNVPAFLLQRAGFRSEDLGKQIEYRYPNLLPTARSQGAPGADRDGVPSHKELSIDGDRAHRLRQLSLWDIKTTTEVTVKFIASMAFSEATAKEHGLAEDDVRVCLVGQLFHGQRELSKAVGTPWRLLRDPVPRAERSAEKGGEPKQHYHNAVWGRPSGTLRFGIRMCNLPREVRLCMTVVACPESGIHRVMEAARDNVGKLLADDVQGHKTAAWRRVAGMMVGLDSEREETLPLFYLGWVNFQLFDHRGFWRGGESNLRMWMGNERANPIGVVSTNNDSNTMAVAIELPQFSRPVRFPCGLVPESMHVEMQKGHYQRMQELDTSLNGNVVNQLRRVREVVQSDPLYQLDDIDKLLLWHFRNDLTQNFRALAKFLQAVEWASPAAVCSALQLLHGQPPGPGLQARRWSPPAKGDELAALELLDARYASGVVREYAIGILEDLDDARLADCILQLVQVLKYEPYHYSALARFLLKRSLRNPHQIGHFVFWHLKAEMYNPMMSERHGLLIEEYLRRSPHRRGLVKQAVVTQQLLQIALRIKDESKTERLRAAKDALQKVELPQKFTIPLDPRLECSGVKVDKCKVMDSKKLPLWLVFQNADPLGKPILVIFKAGDDLRQDLLTLQMITMMDNCWKGDGMDLNMSPYGCIATDDGVGFIEVVTDSETIAEITRKSGGASAAWTAEPMISWLRQQPCNKSPKGAEKCMWNFLHSCAGYCVATYILGIGDRHNDNIMMKRDGTLFHIDFGHFLGNFKTKFGFKRETAPFIFTPMYAAVLLGEKSAVYQHWVRVACAAYNGVRAHAHTIITLFALMLSTGIPELQKPEDIEWLRSVLLMNVRDDEVAAEHYKERIKESLGNKRSQLNDYIHIVAHP
eukprot:TRINITY_DN21706_c0_g1_i1.p1 TRINITY_DN21706_c0_g1~~TRINITY_DN21706_c0_g1_i1.p1  ORF type:complete len:1228 (+),score=464.43 TRINITY_DN21706_c0_g1_i1:95-3685(+)